MKTLKNRIYRPSDTNWHCTEGSSNTRTFLRHHSAIRTSPIRCDGEPDFRLKAAVAIVAYTLVFLMVSVLVYRLITGK